MSESDTEEAVRREAQVAAQSAWREYEKLFDRLDELANEHVDEDSEEREELVEAMQQVEDLVTDLDDAVAAAQEAIGDV